jgi:hypothetical protein
VYRIFNAEFAVGKSAYYDKAAASVKERDFEGEAQTQVKASTFASGLRAGRRAMSSLSPFEIRDYTQSLDGTGPVQKLQTVMDFQPPLP